MDSFDLFRQLTNGAHFSKGKKKSDKPDNTIKEEPGIDVKNEPGSDESEEVGSTNETEEPMVLLGGTSYPTEAKKKKTSMTAEEKERIKREDQVRPLLDLLNEKYMQFGVWVKDLSIDTQTLPCIGRRASAMHIAGKSIRIGFRVWSLCSSTGYLYKAIPCSGSSDYDDPMLDVKSFTVFRLIEPIAHPSRHTLFIDRYFTSHHLFCLLAEKGFCATGEIYNSRTENAKLKEFNQLEKGKYDAQFDLTNNILIVRWRERKHMTVATNYDSIEPMTSVQMYQTEKKNESIVKLDKKTEELQQPCLIANYRQGVGGVKLHEKTAQSYRVSVSSKKWYWPFWLSCIDSSVVNAWKLHCFVANFEKKQQMSLKDFRAYIAKHMLLAKGPYLCREHSIGTEPSKKQRRCEHCRRTSSPWICMKCNVHLHKSCFESFHKGMK